MRAWCTSGVAVLVSLAVGCGDGDKKRPIGATCEGDTECTSGICYEGSCLDPDADDDADGLINRIEVAQGSNPKKRDTDDDGKPDPDEYEALVAKDSDQDGSVDVLESSVADADEDCIVDELDLRNTTSDGAKSERIGELCPAAGACAAEGAVLAVMCRDGLESAACDYAGVPGFEADETSCDDVDNDCDGTTDEGCGAADGAACEDDAACRSGLCAEGVCMDPAADDDLDGLTNGVEADQGSSPRAADTDGDGKPDGDEYDGEVARDGDEDGEIDARESAIADADEDCLSDEVDLRNTTSDGADSPRIAELCLAVGACAAKEAVFAVMCRGGNDSAACEYDGVAGYEASEVSCDGVDNDCDGTTDEGCDPLEMGLIGHWRLDGDGQDSGPHGDHGVVTGATPAPDRFGVANQALRFSAPGDRVLVPATEHPTGEVTVSYTVWARPERGYSYLHHGLFAFGEALATNKRSGLVANIGRGCVEYVGENNDVRSPTTCAPSGHWSFLAVVKSGRTVSFYLDGRLQDTLTTNAGQDLESTALAIGLSKLQGDGSAFEQFYGVLDDLRAYERELTPEEVESLYREGDWQDAGTEARPGHSCLHIRDAAGVRTSGQQWLDVDGDAALPPLEVYCDMTTDGGGWTLAWVYGFTAFDDFQDDANAVTPRPAWPAPLADVPVSKTAPTSPTTPGAIDWALWRELGGSFAILSDLNDGVACEPGEGSIAHAQSGWVDCRTIADVTPTCDGTVPNNVFFNAYGPSLGARSLYYYFDGSTAVNWPTHDPCGENTPQHVRSPAREGGALYLRPTERAVHWPRQCEDVRGVIRANGMRAVDPDGVGGRPPFVAECRFDLERGGWTRLSPDVLTAMEDRGAFPREFFYSKGNAFYRSPITTATWSEDAFAEVTGLWTYSGPTTGDGVFSCSGGAAGDYGAGCGPIPGGIASGQLGRVLPSDAGSGLDLEAGTATICQDPPDAFDADACTEDVDVWVRARDCMPDDGSMIGDGGFDELAVSEENWSSPCWTPSGPNGYMDGYTIDMDEVRPGGAAPSLRVDNPETGNFIAALNLSQRRTSLIAGRSYTLSFWAKAAVRRNMRVFVQPTSLAYGVFWEDLTLDPEWRRYELGFEAGETTWHNQIDFQFAESSTAAVWIDDVALVDAGPSPCGATADGNLLGNGDFTEGRTCWRTGGKYDARLSRLTVDATGGPDGTPTAVLEAFGPSATDGWHANFFREGVPLEAFHRHRLSFKAKSSTARNLVAYLQRWDLGVMPWWNAQVPISAEWRTYTFDFMPTTSSPEDGATLQFDYGLMPAGTIEITDIRLEKLEFDPCTAEVGALQDATWAYGLTCWPFEWHWNELDLYAELDPAEGGALRAEITNNLGGFDYTARVVQKDIQLEAGHGYVLAFRSKGEAARRGYVNIQATPSLYLNHPVHYGTAWKDFELPFVQTETTNAAKLEVGFGGPRATGSTWFGDFALTDLGPAPCATAPGNLMANGAFDKSYVCWELNRNWDEVSWVAHSDDSTFGVAPPSVRLDFGVVTSASIVSFSQRPRLVAGTTYVLTFRAKAATVAMPIVSAWDEVGGSLWTEFQVGPTWTLYSFEFTPTAVSPNGSTVEIQYNSPAPLTLWVDDFSLQVKPAP